MVNNKPEDAIGASDKRSASAYRDPSVSQSGIRGSERKRSLYKSFVGSDSKDAKEKPKNVQVYGAGSMAPDQEINPNDYVVLRGF